MHRTSRGTGILVGLALLLAVLPSTAEARQAVRENQIALAPNEGVVEIGSELRNRLDLFPETQGFLAVRLFSRDDGATVLEVESMREGRLERERRVLLPGELEDLRRLVAVRMADTGEAIIVDREGRGRLVLGQTFLGLAYYGWAVPATLDINSAQGAVATYLLTAGVSFYLPYRLTRERTVSDAHRALSMYGGTRGILVGVLLGDAVSDPDGAHPERPRLGTGVAASLGGSLLGFRAADHYRLDSGRAALWKWMGDFGLMAGAASAYAAGPYVSREITRQDGGYVYVEHPLRNRLLGHAMTLLGGAGGLVAGRWLGEREAYTDG
ncbi:MAG: hypothetical protein EXR92_00935, partial [Gemmatimonadetes bacterium]|nr:hypothetical protein [Gemmatimonadota bacterium]